MNMKNEDIFEQLHGKLAEELLRRILSGEATASDLSVARQFLKDNNVDSNVEAGQEHYLTTLADELPFEEQG